MAGSAVGGLIGGAAGSKFGGQLASRAGSALGLEGEGVESGEEEMEAAKSFVKFANTAVKNAAASRPERSSGRRGEGCCGRRRQDPRAQPA